MSLLIEGMEMPPYDDVFGDERDSVYLCMISVNKNGTACLYCNDIGRTFYPVKAVKVPPTPHGDLVDRDDLIDEINRVTFAERYDYNVAYDIVKSAETVIEMEE